MALENENIIVSNVDIDGGSEFKYYTSSIAELDSSGSWEIKYVDFSLRTGIEQFPRQKVGYKLTITQPTIPRLAFRLDIEPHTQRIIQLSLTTPSNHGNYSIWKMRYLFLYIFIRTTTGSKRLASTISPILLCSPDLCFH
jgi:hypothetical protein